MIDVNKIHQGDCIEVMKTWPANFVDTIITDPPYGIRFMGKAWDGADIEKMVQTKLRKTTKRPDCESLHSGRAFAAGTYDQSLSANQSFQAWCCAWATEALRIAKPGALMLVSGGTRTFHRMTAGLEDAGWEIRDCLMWLYGSGFPKSLDISKAIDKAKGAEREVVGRGVGYSPGRKPVRHTGTNEGVGRNDEERLVTAPATDLAREWSGWGTALKPAWEPIIVAMKPLDGTFAENAEKWGVAGINVDGGRIEGAPRNPGFVNPTAGGRAMMATGNEKKVGYESPSGRWPANLLLDEEAAGMVDGQSGPTRMGHMPRSNEAHSSFNPGGCRTSDVSNNGYGDSGGASRFFYVAKASRSERNEGCEGLPEKVLATSNHGQEESVSGRLGADPLARQNPVANHHPTVKPLKLMEYLCTLTKTPTGGIVLDPFAGSGSTLIAAERTGRPWIGIEMNAEYVAIANARTARERNQMKMAI